MALRTSALKINWQSLALWGPKSFPYSGRWRFLSDTTVESDSSPAEFEPADVPVVTATPVEVINETGRPDKSLVKEFRVGSNTNSRLLGSAMILQLRKHGICEAVASGDESVSRFVKGVAIARQTARRREADDICFQANHSFWIDRNTTNQVLLTLKQTKTLLNETPLPLERLRVRRDTDMRNLARSIKASLSKNGRVDVLAMGTGALSRCVVASIWTRRYCMGHQHDVDCYPSFSLVDGCHDTNVLTAICLTFVERQMDEEVRNTKTLFAIRPPQFYPPVADLQPLEEAFSETLDIKLPIVKVAAETNPRKAAAVFITFLRTCGGVQAFSTGLAANNQSLKSIAISRSCVREIAGYDLGFQCIHSPRESRNGECQMVTWLRLTQDTSKRVALLESDKIAFRVNNKNDAWSVGSAMAIQIQTSHRLDCMAVGPSAVARLLTALSHARIILADKQKDLVALPYFDVIPASTGDREQVRLRCDVLLIHKKTETSLSQSSL